MEADKPRLVSLARSVDGDGVYFHLDDPGMLFVLPRHREQIFATETFEAALGWFSASEVYWERTRRPWFERRVRRATQELSCVSSTLGIDDLHETLAEMEPNADDGGDPPRRYFFRRAQAAVLCDGVDRPRLRVTCDEGATSFVDEVAARVRGAGWTVT
jgi:hypothetical protein